MLKRNGNFTKNLTADYTDAADIEKFQELRLKAAIARFIHSIRVHPRIRG